MPADVIATIRQFRDGTSEQRLSALQRLADRDRFEAIQRLIRLEADAEVRRQLLVYLMQNPRAVERFFDPDRLEQLVESVGADRDDYAVIFCGAGSTAAVEKIVGVLNLRIPADLDEHYELSGHIP